MKHLNYDVILCSCNGSSYITEQLESIVCQRPHPVKVILSDDGSTDNTVSVVKTIMSNYNNIELVIVDGPGKGPSINFLSSLQYSTSEYVFLSDQDDTWVRNKIPKFIEGIEQHTKDIPQLYYSDALLVDESLNSSGITHLQYLNISPNELHFHSLLFRNHVQGATMCLNSNLVKLLNDQFEQYGMNDIVIHDWWCAMIANYFGELIFIDAALINYRQHKTNLVGVKPNHAILKRFFAINQMAKQIGKLRRVISNDQCCKRCVDLFSVYSSLSLIKSIGLVRFYLTLIFDSFHELLLRKSK